MSSPAGCSVGESPGPPGSRASPGTAPRQPPQRVPSAPGELTPLARGLSCLFRAPGSGLGSGLGQEPAAGGTGPPSGFHAGLDAPRASQGGASDCSSCGPALPGSAHKARRPYPVRAVTVPYSRDARSTGTCHQLEQHYFCCVSAAMEQQSVRIK